MRRLTGAATDEVLYGLLVVLILLTSSPSVRSFYVGFGVMLLGMLCRIGATGSKRQELLEGLFRYIRNPHQLGTGLWILGLSLIGRQVDVVLFVCLITALRLRLKIRREDKILLKHWRYKFPIYKKLVPGFLPSFVPYTGGDIISSKSKAKDSPFSIKRAFVMREGMKEISEPILLFYSAILIVLHFMIYKLSSIIAVKWLVAGILALVFIARYLVKRISDRTSLGE